MSKFNLALSVCAALFSVTYADDATNQDLGLISVVSNVGGNGEY